MDFYGTFPVYWPLKALYNSFTHSHKHPYRWQRLPFKMPTAHQDQFRGSLSCKLILPHAARGSGDCYSHDFDFSCSNCFYYQTNIILLLLYLVVLKSGDVTLSIKYRPTLYSSMINMNVLHKCKTVSLWFWGELQCVLGLLIYLSINLSSTFQPWK